MGNTTTETKNNRRSDRISRLSGGDKRKRNISKEDTQNKRQSIMTSPAATTPQGQQSEPKNAEKNGGSEWPPFEEFKLHLRN